MIRSKPPLLIANYGKVKRVEPLQSRITIVVEGNWNLEEREDIEEIESRTEKLKREAAERLDEDNMLEGKMTRNCHLYLQPSKRFKTRPSCERGFLE